MTVLESTVPAAPRGVPTAPATIVGPDARAARRGLGAQVARLERDLSDVLVSAFGHGAAEPVEARGREQEHHRVRLERMLLAPGKHRFETVSNKQLGEGGCGVWQVRPRLGLVGMLAGWWHVKLSSGCPLATARRAAPG